MGTPTPSVPVDLADGTYRLRFTNKALVRLEEQTGWTLMELGAKAQKGSIKAVSSLLWAGMLHEHPEVTVDDAIDKIELTRLQDIGAKANEALEAAFGPKDEAEDDGSAEGNASG